MPKRILHIVLLLLLPLSGWSQVSDLDKGIYEYEKYNYEKALKHLQKATQSPDNATAHNWMGKTFLALGQPDSAQFHLGVAAKTQTQNKTGLWWEYGRLALYNEDSMASREAFAEILKMTPDDPRALEQWDLLTPSPLDSPFAEVKRLPFNSSQSDFGGVPLGNGMLFASERNNSKAGVKYSSSISNTPLSNLYYVERRDSSRWKRNPKPFSTIFNSRLHEGPVWISPDSSYIYFTRSNPNPTEVMPRESIWYSKRVNGNWETPSPISLDLTLHSISHPWVDTQAGILYFSADRPTGFGGMDLYSVPLNNLSWDYARNLGPAINGSGNDVYPVISSEGNLIFASTSHPGYGGLDIYQVQKADEGSLGLHHFPSPINSSKDDFSMYLVDSTQTGWFTSNRKNGKRDDDIYQFSLPIPPPNSLPPFTDCLPPFTDCLPIRNYDFCYTFSDEITGSELPYGLYYQWHFGDGSSKKGIEVDHCFSRTGTYQVQLYVTDSLTGEPVFNQADYVLEVESPYPLFIDGPEVLSQGENQFSAKDEKENPVEMESFYWDWGADWQQGENTFLLTESVDDSIIVRLGVRGKDEQGNPYQECVERTFYTAPPIPTQPVLSAVGNTHSDSNSNDPEPILYRVQLGSSLQALPVKSPLFQKVPGAQERYSNGVFRYLSPETLPLDSALSLLNKYRELGFKHPSVIKDISGERSFRENWLPGDLSEEITVKGQIKDKRDIPIEGSIIWENLRTGEVLMETQIGKEGNYQETLPKEAFYGYYIDLEGYYTVSHHLDLTDYSGDIVIDQDLELVSIDDMIRYQLPVRINNLFFDFDKSTLKSESYPELYRLVRFMQDHPELLFEITGHTDNFGTEEYNMNLSRRRAGQVGKFLVVSGCNPDQMEIRGAGEYEPVSNNQTPAGRQENRRVEFKIKKLDDLSNQGSNLKPKPTSKDND